MPETMKVTRTLEVEVDVEGEYTPGAPSAAHEGRGDGRRVPRVARGCGGHRGLPARGARGQGPGANSGSSASRSPTPCGRTPRATSWKPLSWPPGSATSERLQDARDHEAVRPGAEGPQVADSPCTSPPPCEMAGRASACRHCGAERTITNTGSVKDCVPSTIPAPD